MSDVHEISTAHEAALADAVRAAIDDARRRIGSVLEPACPTMSFLDALRRELERASADPSSVAYPELTDPDAYWEATVKPQSVSRRAETAAIVTWLEERIVVIMAAAEEDLKSLVDVAARDAGLDPAGVRVDLVARVDERCMAVHHLLAEALAILPDATPVAEARRRVEADLRRQATTDVESLKPAYLREAGGDEAHQQFAEQQWSETFADRVAHREALLRSESPWRHMEFALVGYERTRTDVERLVEDAVVRLQAPLLDMRSLLVERYDSAVATTAG